MTRRIVGPFNRVEGDLEVQLEIADGKVADAWVTSPMYRGFEQILHGKDPRDTLVYTPRICGICSVSQSVAAAAALADLAQITMPPNGERAVNLIHACENVADHFTHFYLFFMPDFAREVYSRKSWYERVVKRFKATEGSAAEDAVAARAQLMHLMGLLAGKWPHTLGIQPGGSTRTVESQERIRLLAILTGFRRYLESNLYGDSLEAITALASVDELNQWYEKGAWDSSDLRLFMTVSQDLDLHTLGRSVNRFMSYGVYPQGEQLLFKSGVWEEGKTSRLVPDNITEDIAYSWLEGQQVAAHPFHGVTMPNIHSEQGYTWCKAPRLGGHVVEVGAMARQLVDGNRLIRELVAESGGNVRNRILGRMLEIARVVVAMEQWCRELQPKEPYCVQSPLPSDAEGFGLTEAARGSLGHWIRVRNGRILNYQIVAPTTWNFSPRDAEGVPGALEQALVGTLVDEGERDPIRVQHIVRSFDPCMVCTVH
jgi:Ni,Fe-hydrogenase I large subunit